LWLLEGQDQDDTAHQGGKGQEFVAADLDDAIDEEYLAKDQENREGHKHDPFDRCFGLTSDNTKNGDEGKEYSRQGCHTYSFIMDTDWILITR
jgi:hypothetical protein